MRSDIQEAVARPSTCRSWPGSSWTAARSTSSTRASCSTRSPGRATATPSGTRCRSASTSPGAGSFGTHLAQLQPDPARHGAAAPGSTPLDIAGLKVADAICFDVAYDDGLYAQLSHGGQLLVVQTSNAMFIHTDQIDQQFAISRLRAIETHRYVVVAAINGITGVIAPDGSVVASTAPRTQSYVEADVGLYDAVTPAVRIGPWLGRGCVGLVVLVWRCVVGQYRRSADPSRGRLVGHPRRQDPRTSHRLAPLPRQDAREHRGAGRPGTGGDGASRPTTRPTTWPGSWAGCARPQPDVDVLVVDDNSPDGTGKMADELAAADPQVQVLHRTEKGGLGAAYKHGFQVALEAGLRRDRRDGRRRLPPARAAPAPAGRPRGRRPGDRVALGPRRQRRELAAAARGALARRQPLRPDPARRARCATPPPGYRLFRRDRPGGDRPRARCRAPATSSRPTWSCAACAAGCGSARCRSSSSSGCAATPR